MTTHWLEAYLVQAVQMHLCTKVFCTTCGAWEFRTGVVKALASATGVRVSGEMDESQALAIARALQGVRPVDAMDARLVDAARCLLVDICARIGEEETVAALGDSWGGTVLRSMQEHAGEMRAARRARTVVEEGAHARREEKKLLRKEQHRQRLALKKERDRLWREQNGKVD